MRLALFFIGALGFSVGGVIWLAVTAAIGYQETSKQIGKGLLVCAALMVAAAVLPIP